MKDTRTLTEGAILASVFIILLILSAYVPLVGLITMWALPLPFVIYVYRRGLKPGILLVIVACLLTFLIGGIVTIPATLIFGSAGLVIGELHRRSLSGFSVLLGAGLVFTLNMFIIYLVFVLIIGENPMQIAIDLTKEQMTTIGQIPGQSVEQMDLMLRQLKYLAPLMIVGVGVVLAWISVVLSTHILKRLGHDVNKLPPFRKWTFPKSFLWYYLIVLIIAMTGVKEGTTMYVIISNLFPLLEMILMIQGFAFIFFYVHLKNISKSIPVILFIVAIFFSPLFHIVRMVGIIDLGFDLRKRITQGK